MMEIQHSFVWTDTSLGLVFWVCFFSMSECTFGVEQRYTYTPATLRESVRDAQLKDRIPI